MNPNLNPQSTGFARLVKPKSGPESVDSADLPSWTVLSPATDASEQKDALREGSRHTIPVAQDKLPLGSSPQSYRLERNMSSHTPIGHTTQQSSSEVSQGVFHSSRPYHIIDDHYSHGRPAFTSRKPTITRPQMSIPSRTGISSTNSNARQAAVPRSAASTVLPLLWLVPPQSSSENAISGLKRRPSTNSTDLSHAKKRKPNSHIQTSHSQPIAQKHGIGEPLTIQLSQRKAKVGQHNSQDATVTAIASQSSPRPALQALNAGVGPSSSRGVRSAVSSVPTRNLRPPKPLPSISDNSSAEEWGQVDAALQTHVASVHVLPQYAPSPKDHVAGASGLRVALRHLKYGNGSKGKGRAQPGWTYPRYSKVAEFKERLDLFYGSGDINRGLGRGPRNITRPNADEDESAIVPDTEAADPPGAVAAQGTALTEDEDDTDVILQGMRRGRLENPSPGKRIRAFRPDHAGSGSPEIV